MFAGMSVNGTGVSLCKAAGIIDSGNPIAASVAAVKPACSISLRLMVVGTVASL